jgi:predicted nuclease with TOPRIM domain
MRSILFGLSALSVVAVASLNQTTPIADSTNTTWESNEVIFEEDQGYFTLEKADEILRQHNVTVDWAKLEEEVDEVSDAVSDIEDRWEAYMEYEANYSQEQRKEIKTTLENTYKNTLGKLMMEYGTLVEPLLNHT